MSAMNLIIQGNEIATPDLKQLVIQGLEIEIRDLKEKTFSSYRNPTCT